MKDLKTKFIGQNLLYYEKLESTQDLAHKLAKENVPNGTVIITDNQTKGRGTNDRIWFSIPNSNLTFTIILYPNCYIKNLENITIRTAEIIQKVIYDLYKIELHIKHPNDLILNSKKIGGILTESKVQGNVIKELIIGIGMNINQEIMPEEIQNIATSLKIETGRYYDKEEILTGFFNTFENNYLNIVESISP